MDSIGLELGKERLLRTHWLGARSDSCGGTPIALGSDVVHSEAISNRSRDSSIGLVSLRSTEIWNSRAVTLGSCYDYYPSRDVFRTTVKGLGGTIRG